MDDSDDRADMLAASAGELVRSPAVAVGSLVRRPALVCQPASTVGEVARAMAREHTSAALIPLEAGLGLVTDVDLRTKVLAVGRDPSVSVQEIATSPVITIDADAAAAEALFQMVKGGFHHLPVLDVDGQVTGVVTETDVIGFGADSPFAIRSAIERAPDVSAAVAEARRLRGSLGALVEGGVDAVHVGHIVGATIDALTVRLLDLAFQEHGDPPVDWAWLAFGSLGRHEQALHTDQDHGLAFAGSQVDEERLDPYFAIIAESVTSGLEEAGLPRCKGKIMATNHLLRRSLPGWIDAFEAWIESRDQPVAGNASIVFDFRRVAGPLDVESSLDAVIRDSRRRRGFLRRLALHALAHKPPTGVIRDFRVEGSGEHAGRVDLKHGGIVPITDLARLHAVVAGVPAHRTLDRLRLAGEAGRIENGVLLGLEEAFVLLWELRMDHQLHRVRAGLDPDDFVDPDALTPLRRQGLREAFRMIVKAQRIVEAELAWTR